MAAKFEEVVVCADAIHLQHFGPNRRQLPFQRRSEERHSGGRAGPMERRSASAARFTLPLDNFGRASRTSIAWGTR